VACGRKKEALRGPLRPILSVNRPRLPTIKTISLSPDCDAIAVRYRLKAHTTQILFFEITLTAAVQPETSSSYFGSRQVSFVENPRPKMTREQK
jgi:hypothetical protein